MTGVIEAMTKFKDNHIARLVAERVQEIRREIKDRRIELNRQRLIKIKRRSHIDDHMVLLRFEQLGILTDAYRHVQILAERRWDNKLLFDDTVHSILSKRDSSAPPYCRPADWAGSTDYLKAAYSSIVLIHTKPSYRISMRLGRDRTQHALSSRRGLLGHVAREVRSRLRAPANEVEFWFTAALPADDQGTVQGAIGGHGLRVDHLRSVLADVAKNSDDFRAVKVSRLKCISTGDTMISAATTLAKNVREGAPLTCSQNLGAAAKDLYGFHSLVYRFCFSGDHRYRGSPE